MTSQPNHDDEYAREITEQFFTGPTYPQNTNFPPPIYPQNTNYTPTPPYYQTPQQFSRQIEDHNFFPQSPNPTYNFTGGAGGSSDASTLSPDIQVPASGIPRPDIQVDTTSTPTSSEPLASDVSKMKRKKPTPTYNAPWWRFYEQIFDEKKQVIGGKCKVKGCQAKYSYSSRLGTSSLNRHAEKYIKSKEEPQEYPDPSHVQTLINSDGTRTHQKYDEKRMLNEFAQYIAHKEQPISMGNCLSFARLIIKGCGQPMYKRIHHRKMTKEIKRQYIDRKNGLLALFSLATFKVSLTSDIWTAGKHGLGYYCITAHYIDNNWVLQKRVLSFHTMDFPHTAQIIYQSIMNVLREYNLKNDLENKVFSISFDNASNNVKSIDYFKRALSPIMDGTMFHQKCACHILNLTVKAGLKTPGVDSLITKFKNGLHHIYSNNVRKQEFHALCERLQLSKLRVPWDVDTRWNSTYRMLRRCLPYHDAINDILNNSPEGLHLLLSSGEWNQLAKLMKFLQAFFNATVKLSCSYTPTVHELLHHLFYITKLYNEMKGTLLHDIPF